MNKLFRNTFYFNNFIDFLYIKGKQFCSDIGLCSDLRPFSKLFVGCKNLVGVEIGVKEGVNSLSMLEYLNIKKLYGIDPYLNYNDYQENWFSPEQNTFNIFKNKAHKRLSKYIGKFEFVELLSDDASYIVPNNLDFVYIDGNHKYDFVKNDINIWYKKIKVGGVIGGHDFFDMTDDFDVHTAVIEFAVKHKLKLYFRKPDWWIYKK